MLSNYLHSISRIHIIKRIFEIYIPRDRGDEKGNFEENTEYLKEKWKIRSK